MSRNFMDFSDKVKASGLESVQCSQDHWQVIGGKFIVNYYPFAKRGQKIYIASTSKGIEVSGVSDVIRYANELPKDIPSEERRASYSKQIRWLLRKGNQCGICLKPVKKEDASVDHIIPLSKGGLNNRNNYQLAHKNCNHKKGSSV